MTNHQLRLPHQAPGAVRGLEAGRSSTVGGVEPASIWDALKVIGEALYDASGIDPIVQTAERAWDAL